MNDAFLILVVQNLVNGILFGGVLSLTAVGLTLIFGTLDIPNFAQGEFAMLGGLLTIVLAKFVGVPLLVAAAASVVVVFAFGVLCERVLIAPFYRRGREFFLLSFFITFALALFVEDLVKNIYPTMYEAIPTGLTQSVKVGFLQVGLMSLVGFAVPMLLLLSLYVFSKRTLLGLAMSAVSQDELGAHLVGINKKRIYSLTFGLGAALSGVSGILYGLLYAVYPSMGMELTSYGFTIVVLGGVGNFLGAIIASLLIGLIGSMTATFTQSSYQLLVVFLVLIVALTLRPRGLLGGKVH